MQERWLSHRGAVTLSLYDWPRCHLLRASAVSEREIPGTWPTARVISQVAQVSHMSLTSLYESVMALLCLKDCHGHGII